MIGCARLIAAQPASWSPVPRMFLMPGKTDVTGPPSNGTVFHRPCEYYLAHGSWTNVDKVREDWMCWVFHGNESRKVCRKTLEVRKRNTGTTSSQCDKFGRTSACELVTTSNWRHALLVVRLISMHLVEPLREFPFKRYVSFHENVCDSCAYKSSW